MSKRRTGAIERTYEESQDERTKVRPAAATELLLGAMRAQETCVTRAAFNLGMSEALMRKLRAGDAQLGLADLMGMARHEPALFDEIMDRLASLRGHVVVEQLTSVSDANDLEQIADVVKEHGEAVAASIRAVSSKRADDRRVAIREHQEAAEKHLAQARKLELADAASAVRSVRSVAS